MITKKLNYAKCSFEECTYPAEWVMGTWQCCDLHAKEYITETEAGFISLWGTAQKLGQKIIYEHNVKYGLCE